MTHDCSLGITGAGPAPAEIMAIGIAPGRDEWQRSRRPLTGESGKLFDTLLLDYGKTERREVFTTNLHCLWNDKPTQEEIDACLPRLLWEIESVKPKLMILMGKLVAETLAPYDFGKANHGVFWSETFNCWQLITYHPAAYLYDDGPDIADGVRDFRKVRESSRWPQNNAACEYVVMPNLKSCDQMLAHFYMISHESSVVAIDVECYRDDSSLRSIAFSCKHGTYHIPESLVYGPYYEYLTRANCRWAFHNGQFDVARIRKHLKVNLRIHEDTMLQSYSLDERCGDAEEIDSRGRSRAVGIHGLKSLAREYIGAGFYEANVKIETCSPEQLAEYNSKDAYYTYRLQRMFEQRQIDDNVRDMYLTLLIPGANIMAEITEQGIAIDEKFLAELGVEWYQRWLDLEERLQTLALEIGWTDNNSWINLDSPKQVAKLIYDVAKHPRTRESYNTPIAPRTTRAKALQEIAEGKPSLIQEFCATQLEWRGVKTDLSHYVESVDANKDSQGFIHPEALLHGTRNGRLSYHNPPIQTIPQPSTVGEERAKLRKLFIAKSDEYILVEADNRQSELWAAAMLSNDQQMLEDLRSGDFHSKGAEEVFNISQADLDKNVWGLYRSSYKRICYNNLYGGGPQSLIGRGTHAVGKFNVLTSLVQARKVQNNFNARFPAYARWRTQQKEIISKTGEQQTLSGRKRRYYWVRNFHTLNQGINSPVSSLSHDHLMLAWLELHPLLKEFDSRILLENHDSILFEVRKDYLVEALSLIERIMTTPRYGASYGIPIDIKIGRNWLDMVPSDAYISDVANIGVD